jgi:hypothetical protein
MCLITKMIDHIQKSCGIGAIESPTIILCCANTNMIYKK